MTKRMELKTKVKVIYGNKANRILPEEYTCALIQKPEKEVCLEITADKSTCGKWSWYLSTLTEHGVSDVLSLEFSQNWYVVGISKVFQEIMKRYNLPD